MTSDRGKIRMLLGLRFFWIPSRFDAKYNKLRWNTAKYHGAYHCNKWDDGVTHVIVDDELDLTTALRILGRRPSDHPSSLVRWKWVTSSIERLQLQPLEGTDFLVGLDPYPTSIAHVGSGSTYLPLTLKVNPATTNLSFTTRVDESWETFTARMYPYLTHYDSRPADKRFPAYPIRITSNDPREARPQDLIAFVQSARHLLDQSGDSVAVDWENTLRNNPDKFPDPPPSSMTLRNRILQLAREHNVATGFWILRLSEPNADDDWLKVARLTQTGELGDSAEVLPGDTLGQPRIFRIHTHDFDDHDRIRQVLRAIHENDIAGRSVFYKPTCFELLGIKSNNRFAMRTSLFMSNSISDIDSLTITTVATD